MIKFPDEFVATRYPGYYWNTKDRQLYTIKVTGVLQPLKKYSASAWQKQPGEYYKISQKGKRHHLLVAHLQTLVPSNQTIPVIKK